MSADATAAQPVTLEYTLTADDLFDGLTAAHRVLRRPWYLRRPVLYLVGGLIGIGIVASKSSAGFDEAWMAAVFLVIVLVIGLGVAHLVLRLFDPARLSYRWSARQMIRGNPMLAQPLRVSVDDAGVRIVGATGETTVTWGQHPYHVETARSFVLLASERLGAAVLVLPKRVVGETDAAGLRALLAAHTRRLG